jgi:hypothetical protein
MIQKNILIDNEYSKIEFENGIIITTWKSSFINLTTIKQLVNNRLKATAGKKYPVLLKMKSIKDSTKEARDFLASEEGGKDVLAVAVYVNSVLENMIANFFIYLNKPLVPTKVFKDETKAKEWLANYIEKNESVEK